MASNYIIFNNADEGLTSTTYPDWDSSWVGLTNQDSGIALSTITGFYAGDSWGPDADGNSMTPFQFPLTSTTGTSKWIMIRYDYVDASTTGATHLTSVVNALKTYINTTQGADSLDAEYSNIISGSMSTFFGTTLGLSNITNGTFASASYNWSLQDTTGSTYSDGFASSMSGNEDYATDYWSKTDFQTDTVNPKDQIIEKIATNQDDIIEFLVKNSLTPESIKRLHVQLSNDGIIT